jgi:hypothetical protein
VRLTADAILARVGLRPRLGNEEAMRIFSTLSTALCLCLAIAASCAAAAPAEAADAPAPGASVASKSSAMTPAATAAGDAAAKKHAKRTACLKDAKSKKLVGADKTSYLKNCIAAP